MKRVYFDTNQMYYIRRIADEAAGSDFGDYRWAERMFPGSPELVRDIRALCYIIALQYEWELDFLPSNASFMELGLSDHPRAKKTREAWELFCEGLKAGRFLSRMPILRKEAHGGELGLSFIEDADDRAILWDFALTNAEVFVTSDCGILAHRDKLAKLDLVVMRPSEWLDRFLGELRDGEDAVAWLERILFSVGRGT